MKKKELYLNQTEFAKKVGKSNAAIINAIKRGRIFAIKKSNRVFIEYYSQSKRLKDTAPIDLKSGNVSLKVAKIKASAHKTNVSKANGKNLKDSKAKAEGASGDKIITDLHDARLESEIYKAKKSKLEYEKMQESVLDAEAVRKTWLGIAQNLKKSILGIPARIGPLAAAEKDPLKCTMLIMSELKISLKGIIEEVKEVT